MGPAGHRFRDAVGYSDETGRRRGEERLPQQRLLRHAVLRHSVAARHGERLLGGQPFDRLCGPFVRVQLVEQGLYRPEHALHRRTGPPRRERRIRFGRAQLLRRLVHQPAADARFALRAGHFEPVFRAGPAVGPQRRGGYDRRGAGDRHAHLLAVRAERLPDGWLYEGR